ncbi:NAD(P)-dependent dehydrogenase (short-subunit alcohol dehydrogenase family) [Algoriphagus aquaeductus]|uniref:NAD(P)-dependent dehydrogenase (Short-subunit alcohol dehydrogenase family) n=1 Tax=Algoriphagus aquaeductus TaxID=475299 RepID=A0A326RL27_9BACT|nr:SDR family oxidoreductase [Algoriphagus aquaeductus]PZV79145.1 NAD(P)-dependent dehydrogenase (short-subunit alcohol dehydrogenase family) [Algoriphagus aquaeductus]
MNPSISPIFDLSGRIALVTGGAGLLASEHAIALMDHGAQVVLADKNIESCNQAVSLLQEKGYQKIQSMELDVTSRTNWESVASSLEKNFGKIDVLVNNAGFTNQSKSKNFDAGFEDFPLEDWNNILNVNLTGSFLGCQVIGKCMLENGKGSIINIASLYGVVSPNHKIYPGTGISQPVAYSVSKHGVVALTKYLATLWAEKGIRVNSLTPGGIWNGHHGLFLERFQQLNPIGRMSDKSELRGGIVYLASDASSHVVGHNLIIDGGWTAW